MSRPDEYPGNGIDLSPLDPELDPERLERVVSGVLGRLGPGIVEEPPSLTQQVAQLYARRFRPLFAAASVVAIAASLLLVSSRRSGDGRDVVTADLVSVPTTWAAWMATGAPPPTEALLFSLVGEDR